LCERNELATTELDFDIDELNAVFVDMKIASKPDYNVYKDFYNKYTNCINGDRKLGLARVSGGAPMTKSELKKAVTASNKLVVKAEKLLEKLQKQCNKEAIRAAKNALKDAVKLQKNAVKELNKFDKKKKA